MFTISPFFISVYAFLSWEVTQESTDSGCLGGGDWDFINKEGRATVSHFIPFLLFDYFFSKAHYYFYFYNENKTKKV